MLYDDFYTEHNALKTQGYTTNRKKQSIILLAGEGGFVRGLGKLRPLLKNDALAPQRAKASFR